ncbi:MAG: M18 family aminopeptidase [Planctomycetes bacterium]|nr:M18 family aminopeptidase [Planctomycetota bacterium]
MSSSSVGRDSELARDLCAFVDAAPTPFHACAEVARRLEANGFRELREGEAWARGVPRAFVMRGGSLAAWVAPEGAEATRGWRIVGAHTDSPNLRLKPRPDTARAGLRQLAVEVYGGVLLNSWLDRDLALAGRAFVRGADGPVEQLFALPRPLLRIPQLAIHLNREIATEGLHLNPQLHLNPLFAHDTGAEPAFRELLGEALHVDPGLVLSWDAMLHDAQPARLVGLEDEFVSAPRLDNLASCFCALTGLLARLQGREPLRHVAALCFFDHEEVGSTSSRGAQSGFLRDVLERAVLTRGGAREELHRALAASACVSADMAHATHPNFPEKHEPEHPVRMNAGPAIKTNVNQRYASEGSSEALFLEACARAEVPCQRYVHRGDMACGSTIGPLTAAALGLQTVDVGNPMLAMHSARELCGAYDAGLMARALAAFFE